MVCSESKDHLSSSPSSSFATASPCLPLITAISSNTPCSISSSNLDNLYHPNNRVPSERVTPYQLGITFEGERVEKGRRKREKRMARRTKGRATLLLLPIWGSSFRFERSQTVSGLSAVRGYWMGCGSRRSKRREAWIQDRKEASNSLRVGLRSHISCVRKVTGKVLDMCVCLLVYPRSTWREIVQPGT